MAQTEAVAKIIESFLTVMPVAGQYATRIQSTIERRQEKEGMDNPFGAALTDADLSLQNFFEVYALAKFPGVSFFGEEEAESLNMKYFPAGCDLKILLDPIDGTRYYADNLDNFNIILSVVSADGFEGAIVYVPRRDACYYAIRGRGAFVCTTADLIERKPGNELTLSADSELVLTYRHPEIAHALAGEFSVLDVVEAYKPGIGCPGMNCILWSECAVLACKGHGLIDWGAISCIVENAGGVVSAWDGSAVPTKADLETLKYKSIVMAADKKTHDAVVSLLANS